MTRDWMFVNSGLQIVVLDAKSLCLKKLDIFVNENLGKIYKDFNLSLSIRIVLVSTANDLGSNDNFQSFCRCKQVMKARQLRLKNGKINKIMGYASYLRMKYMHLHGE